MGFFKNKIREYRAGQIEIKKERKKQIESKERKTEKDNKELCKLARDIGRLKEANKIASEINSRTVNNFNSNNKSITQNNGINNPSLTYNNVKVSNPKKK